MKIARRLIVFSSSKTPDQCPSVINLQFTRDSLRMTLTLSIDQSGQETPLTIKTKTPGESAQKIDGHFPFELTQGKMGKLIIKDIKTANNETVVRYTAEGKAPYLQGSRLHIKNAAGEYVTPKQYIKRDEEHPNEFTMVFPALEGNQQYSVSTSRFENIDFMEELKIMIELR
ncbi:MAG: hypothetical protein ACYDEJ_15165 [Desulfitobacteriaceae bacterium]